MKAQSTSSRSGSKKLNKTDVYEGFEKITCLTAVPSQAGLYQCVLPAAAPMIGVTTSSSTPHANVPETIELGFGD